MEVDVKCALILIAGVYLNPWTIQSMSYDDWSHQCIIEHNQGDAWTGQYKTFIKTTCEEVNKALNKGK